jgi:hypothetical protein
VSTNHALHTVHATEGNLCTSRMAAHMFLVGEPHHQGRCTVHSIQWGTLPVLLLLVLLPCCSPDEVPSHAAQVQGALVVLKGIPG